MFSFHATKLFHTAEGGALTTPRGESKSAFDHLKNFGILNPEEVDVVGINGKMNELQAALGLAVLACVTDEVERRRVILDRYRANLGDVPGVVLMPELPGVRSSYQSMAVRFDRERSGCSRDDVCEALKGHNVIARKYFYPLCSDYACYRDLPSAAPGHLPVAREVVEQVLCLPIYGTLPLSAVDTICEIVAGVQARA
jgi:dTDP-4-amino-4,6-dideoxygalactose transaminase